MNRQFFIPAVILFAAGFPGINAVSASASTVDFNRDIRPILSKHCFACHGPDEAAREADLRLDTADGADADLGGHRAVVAGDLDASELIARIESTDPDLVMPPSDSGQELSDDDKRLLREWIVAGADYDIHWSFVPPVKAPLPKSAPSAAPQEAIDAFVSARLEAAGLALAEPADRLRLLRRLSLDITGLPPTVEEADAFAADSNPRAAEHAVDRLLASPAFGEHWARMWLDLARYADTSGYEKDLPRTIWRYRDWVIRSLNADMPFDQFTIEQLAGDLLPEPTTEQLIATAFHRNTMTNSEGGTDDEEFRVAAVKDRVDTTMQIWMGLTMGCAKCHSHKFDPISHQEYYEFFAYFNQTEDADRFDDQPLLETPVGDQAAKLKELEARVAAVEAEAANLPTDDADRQKQHDDKFKAVTDELNVFRAEIPKTPVMRELPDDKRRKTHIHTRGNFLSPGEFVEPHVPGVFGSVAADATSNRLAVAQWLVDDANPLTSRVMVNRVWARLFGRGIVETEEDFGSQGTPPTHPELLDWLAVDFRENGRSLKQLIRTIVLSSTYQQSAEVTPDALAADPRNALFSRGARFRLPAETVRDQALAVSGLLTEKVGGPSVMPPQPDGIWKSTYSTLTWESATGADRYRRALYTYWKRTSPYPAMMTFDAGSGEVCQVRRVRTNTPLQALVTLNDPAFVEAAGALAQRMESASGDTKQRLIHGFRCVLIRHPSAEEVARLTDLHDTMNAGFQAQPGQANDLQASAGVENVSAALIAAANVLLNLDEALMRQ